MSDTSRIRNFCIIAHIDHGKSTLADRLLEETGTLSKREMRDRTMDTLQLEQERGITIKLQTARMEHEFAGGLTSDLPKGKYILNLIDTPGHVDFSYEVSRSVAACEGALLLVDATQGVQAQTLSVMYKALEYNLKVIPVVNKIDLPNAEVDRVKREIVEIFGFDEDEIILASGKSGAGVRDILNAIVTRTPAPAINTGEVTKALVFDSFYHDYKGVVALVKLQSGAFKSQGKVYFVGSQAEVKPVEIGYLKPALLPNKELSAGEVGYIATGLKDIKRVHVGDTVTNCQLDGAHRQVTPLSGYKAPKSMVFASLYPVEASDFPEFQEAVEKLSLNDAAFTYQRETSPVLGTGFVCGFLGLLHLEIIQERLDQEFGVDLISTSPTVEYKVQLTTKDYSKVEGINTSRLDSEGYLNVRIASEFPDGSLIKEVLEPWVRLEIFTPEEYVGPVMELCQENRGVYKSMEFTNKDDALSLRHAILHYEIPAAEIVVNFFDKLKSISRGYASMDYIFLEHRKGDVVKVSMLVNHEEAEPLSFLVHKSGAERRARAMVEKLADIIPKQQFEVPIQAAIGGKIIARADIKPYRKDVTAKLYGGDETRKKKLREKQKKGKKRMKAIGSVHIPKEAFLAALRT